MGKKKSEAPNKIQLTDEEVDALKERIAQNTLDAKDREIFLSLLCFNLWLQERLSRAKLSINRLRKLFGFSSESNKKASSAKSDGEDKSSPETSDNDDNPNTDSTDASTEPQMDNDTPTNHLVPTWDESKNHGRHKASDYTGCTTVDVPFVEELLLAGKCPKCAACDTEAPIDPIKKPSVVTFLQGQSLICGTAYHLQKGRCRVCQTYFTAPLPDDVSDQPKYAPSCYSAIAIHHYHGGFPFKRLETLQAAQRVPLPDSTQFDLMNTLYRSVVEPIATQLTVCAANGEGLFFDDTPGRIIEQTVANRYATTKQDKKSIHATALLSDYQGNRIYVFGTNTQTAGTEFESVINQRTSDAPFTTMSDASSRNFPELDETLCARWVITLCLVHGRRRFFELLDDDEPNDDIQFVINCIADVYQHERHCKENDLSEDARLSYHQKQSKPLMEALYIWFVNLLKYEKVALNSRFGEAITYMLKRWHWLTQFLRVKGAALDNNICELAIKILIRYRKNSLFYKTAYGARIGDAMMSVIYTAERAGVNIFDYLNTLQLHAEQVQQAPEKWLPWCYQGQVENQTAQPDKIAV